ncbi:hypothetical protein P4S83_07550 [Aneurinibacillus thermoaerophilus]|uniref:hypothetical protein n=1 Tax=Aneurinibacillus thermoaerophilus TaxID=143495 RepID=UPI002E2136B5|nr:hypothetical protein [Aneurinibacillus thermoaerophilus]MED0765974.1 hypothetical protein [Aneurinibacillus thermoaerophilus]
MTQQADLSIIVSMLQNMNSRFDVLEAEVKATRSEVSTLREEVQEFREETAGNFAEVGNALSNLQSNKVDKLGRVDLEDKKKDT